MLDNPLAVNMDTSLSNPEQHHLTPIFLQPRESVTGGKSEYPCFVFGNGVEIENRVCSKVKQEGIKVNHHGITSANLVRDIRRNAEGIDIVKVHFLPETSVTERASDVSQVPPQERAKIRTDCIQGFLSLAKSLVKNELSIVGHNSATDFYLLAEGTPGLALFLINNCSFRGNARTGRAWIRASEFSTEDNMHKMIKIYQQFIAV